MANSVLKKFSLAMCWIAFPPAVFGQAPAESSSPSEDLTVMTWNLEWFYDDYQGDNYSQLSRQKSAPSRSDWDWRRDAIAQSIAKVQPTILAVQEAESRRVLWYLARALSRNHQLNYRELAIEGRDHFTQQDVGLLIRPPVDVLSLFQGTYPRRMRSTNQYFDVSKHLMAVLEFQHGTSQQRVIVMNVHLRSKPEGQSIRIRQVRLLQHWLAEKIRVGADVILLGDFNTEETGPTTRPESELGIACGLETPSVDDDLIDLNLRLSGDRQTHLLDGRQFDRILCSRSLLEDDPSRPDLVFTKIEIARQLVIRGRPDTPQEHWDSYWTLAPEERDLSDHYPVIATFQLR